MSAVVINQNRQNLASQFSKHKKCMISDFKALFVQEHFPHIVCNEVKQLIKTDTKQLMLNFFL